MNIFDIKEIFNFIIIANIVNYSKGEKHKTFYVILVNRIIDHKS